MTKHSRHTTANFIAIDLGASGGRVIVGRWDGQQLGLEILHRFSNGPVRSDDGHLHWDIGRLWREIKVGLSLYATHYPEPLISIGVDSWAVDFGLLNKAGNLLGQPFHYRDARTAGVMEQVLAQIPRSALYVQTGIQFLPFNTLYQLYAMSTPRDPLLEQADSLLMIPDLINYWLCGAKVCEYTNATTTQFLEVGTGRWATTLLDKLGIPGHFLPPLVSPGTILGQLRPALAQEVGLVRSSQIQAVQIIAPATHDTGSAVVAVPGLDSYSAYLSSGTWSLLGVETKLPVLSDATLVGGFTNEGGVGSTTRLLKNIGGLWLLQECQRIWREQGHDYAWEELLAASDRATPFTSVIDPDAPDFLSPTAMPAAIQAYCGRTNQVVPSEAGQIVRICLESLALKYRQVTHALEELVGHRLEVLRIVGGGSQNARLCQLAAGACERPLVAGPVEATAYGNVLVQMLATGYLDTILSGRGVVAASSKLQSYAPKLKETEGWEVAFQRLIQLQLQDQ